jgi:hypothetical protein
MPGVSGVTVVTNARVYYTPRAAAGAPSARHSRALCFQGERTMHRSGVSRHGNADVRLDYSRHCEERKRRSNPFFLCAAKWIASLALAMTV